SFGEIDVIAKKRPAPLNKISQILIPPWTGLFNRVKKLFNNDNTIHFVEVKTIVGSNPSITSGQIDSFFPEERVDYKKQRKLKNLAQIWLQKNKSKQNHPYQIDIIGILVNQETKNAKLHYFANVVQDI